MNITALPIETEAIVGNITIELPFSSTSQKTHSAITEANAVATASWADQADEDVNESAFTLAQPKKQGNKTSTRTRGNNKPHHK